MDRYSVTFLQKCINPITVGGGGVAHIPVGGNFFPTLKTLKVLIYKAILY